MYEKRLQQVLPKTGVLFVRKKTIHSTNQLTRGHNECLDHTLQIGCLYHFWFWGRSLDTISTQIHNGCYGGHIGISMNLNKSVCTFRGPISHVSINFGYLFQSELVK